MDSQIDSSESSSMGQESATRRGPNSCSGDTGDSSSSSEGQVNSILSILRGPAPSHLTLKRKVSSIPPIGTKQCKSSTNFDPKCVKPLDCIEQFPGEYLVVSAGKLFCSVCWEQLPSRKPVINLHIKSTKHDAGKERLLCKCQNEKTIAKAIKCYESDFHPIDETLPESTRVYRVKVVISSLKAGIPLVKFDNLRQLFGE